MHGNETINERKKRIDTIIDYIFKNLHGDVSLQTLAGIANYSLFHFQKLFKDIIGVSPKQYIIKIRLETALHLLVIHPQKSVMEISIECGFSSPAVFSRAVNNYFGVPPEEIRKLPPKERIQIFNSKNPHDLPNDIALTKQVDSGTLEVRLKRVEALNGIYMITPFKNYLSIQQTFNQLLQTAKNHDLLNGGAKMLGILSPHEGNIYKAFISVENTKAIPAKYNQTKIKAGKYASFMVKGGKIETLTAAHLLFQQWLPANGYKITGAVCFECFSESPAGAPYQQLEREFFVPIEPLY